MTKLEKADAARTLTLVGVVYNVLLGLLLGANAPTVLSVPPFRPWGPLGALLLLLIEVGVLAGSLLLPCIAYYRITRTHHRSAGILRIIGGRTVRVLDPRRGLPPGFSAETLKQS